MGADLDLDDLVADWPGARAELRILRADSDHRDALLREAEDALRRAEEWMDPEGCDCGAVEPGACVLCLATATLAKLKQHRGNK